MKGVWVKIRNKDWRPRSDIKHPTWFKCSNRILEDEDFYAFSFEEIAVWIHILSLASQKDSDTVFVNYEAAERKARLKQKFISSAVEKLSAKQLDIMPERDAYVTRTDHVRNTGPGIERNREERKGEEESQISSAGPTLPHLAVLWNNHCGGKLSKVTKSNAARDKKSKARFSDHSDLEWVGIIERIAASDFCCGGNDRGWKATFDWLLQPETALKVLEGKYDNRVNQPSTVDLSEIFGRAGA